MSGDVNRQPTEPRIRVTGYITPRYLEPGDTQPLDSTGLSVQGWEGLIADRGGRGLLLADLEDVSVVAE